jgi:protein-S-isoprenylcysteine O-methyltransferase Ste14
MTDPVSTYLTVLFIGIALTIAVGQILIRSGRPFLADVFREPETARSVTRLLVVLFHLVVLGVIALVATIDITLAHPIQTIVVRVGLVLLVVGAAYGGALLVLTRLRARRRVQMLLDEKAAQAEQARQAQSQQYGHQGLGAQYPPPAAQTYPVIEPGPGR